MQVASGVFWFYIPAPTGVFTSHQSASKRKQTHHTFEFFILNS